MAVRVWVWIANWNRPWFQIARPTRVDWEYLLLPDHGPYAAALTPCPADASF